MANGTTDGYSQALQQTLGGAPNQPGPYGTGLGFSPAQIAQMQQAGVSVSDLQSLGLVGSPTTTTTGVAGAQIPPNQAWTGGQQQNAALVRMMMKLGGGGQQQQGPSAPPNAYGTQYPLYAVDAQGNPTGNPVYANPSNQASLLGAAALGIGGGYSPVVINPPPSGTPSSRSGVAPTGGVLIGTSTPQVGWGTGQSGWTALGQAAGFSPTDIAAFQRQGLTPEQVAKQFNVQSPLGGPWTNPQIGSVFTQVARTAPTMTLGATPLQGAVQPTATGYNPTPTTFAQAPPAPGLQIPQIPQTPLVAAHTNALADAGQALFRHLTGNDPASASPADIANFHNQLTDSITNYTAGATRGGPGVTALAAAPQPTAAKKMQSGGRVPGRGNEDTVPALLTPGEYVIPKPQVQQLMRTGKLPIKMADGGTVPDSDQNAPPEARRKTLSAQTSQTPPPSAPGGGYSGPSLAHGLATAAQSYASSMANLPRNPIGSGSGVDIRNTRLDPDPDLPSLKAAGMLGSGLSSPGAQSALGGVASGLNQAAQAIASSAQPWRMQQNAIPAPPPAPAAPQFAQQQIPQQIQQGGNQYAAYAMNQARYPTSPYYT